jgi:hypothetical protein
LVRAGAQEDRLCVSGSLLAGLPGCRGVRPGVTARPGPGTVRGWAMAW